MIHLPAAQWLAAAGTVLNPAAADPGGSDSRPVSPTPALLAAARQNLGLLPHLIRRPVTLRAIVYMGRMGGFTGSKVTDPRTIDGDRPLADVPGRPRVVTLPGHTPGSVGYLFADRGLLFTGDALVTYDGITGYRGPAVSSRAFTHDSRAALASLTALDAVNADLLLPGHGEPFPGAPADAVAQARSAGAR